MARLSGCVDVPTPGSTVPRGRVLVQGWALWGERPAVAVEAHVNGILVGQTVTGTDNRGDVGRALGNPELSLAGWCLFVDLGWLVNQDAINLDVTVWVDPAIPPVRFDSVALRLSDDSSPDPWAPGFIGSLDLPVAGEPVGSDFIKVSGWLLDPTATTAGVDVLVNGKHAGRARLGLDRPSVEAICPLPHAAISGFEHLVDLRGLPPTETRVRLQVVARTIGGRPQVVLQRTVPRLAVPTGRASPEHDTLPLPAKFLSSVSPPVPGDLNLAVFTHQLDLGGAQLWLSELLARSGAGRLFPCTVIALRDGPLRGELEEQGITVHVTAPAPVDDLAAYQGRITELSMLVATEGANAALVNTITSWVGADVTTRMGISTVWAIHESLSPAAYWAQSFPPGHVQPAISASVDNALRASSALVFVAEATRRLYEPTTDPDRTLVIPYGVDTQMIEAYREGTSRSSARALTLVPEGSKLLLVMGTTEPRKAQTRLVEAFAHVAANHPEWQMVFVGETGTPYATELKRFVRRMDLDDRVRVVPVVAHTYAWYRSADLLVSASDLESLPRSVLEAMCFGVPVLATSIFGMTELVTEGETGFLFEPSDLAAAIAALDRVMGLDAEARAATGRAGRNLVLDGYDSLGYCTDIPALLHALAHGTTDLPADIVAESRPRARSVVRSGGEPRA
jgi:D-inositol-3-phosphate glycosyltransferase